MANESVAIPSRSINSVSHLSYLIEAALQESCKEPSEFHENYRRQFATLVGLGFTAILVKGGQVQFCHLHLLAFLNFGNDFTQCTTKFESLSAVVAEIICSAISPFRFLGMPRYFDDFLLSITNVVYPPRMELVKKKEKIKQLLQILFEECD
jgi:hypothetical protein